MSRQPELKLPSDLGGVGGQAELIDIGHISNLVKWAFNLGHFIRCWKRVSHHFPSSSLPLPAPVPSGFRKRVENNTQSRNCDSAGKKEQTVVPDKVRHVLRKIRLIYKKNRRSRPELFLFSMSKVKRNGLATLHTPHHTHKIKRRVFILHSKIQKNPAWRKHSP